MRENFKTFIAVMEGHTLLLCFWMKNELLKDYTKHDMETMKS